VLSEIAVIVGVALETPAVFGKEENQGRWVRRAGRAGHVILVLGLAGEIHFGAAIAEWETRFRVHARKQMARLEKKAADANERAAKLENENLELWRRVRPRRVDGAALVAALKNAPPATVEILYRPDDPEAYGVALQLMRWIGPGENGDGGGWDVEKPSPIPLGGGDPRLQNAPLETRWMAWSGMGILSSEPPERPFWQAEHTSLGALQAGLLRAGLSAQVSFAPGLVPPGRFVIVVGQKPT